MQYPDSFTNLDPEDDVLHTPEKPFCFDSECPCHEDNLYIMLVNLYVLNGLMTPEEATDFVMGKGI